MHCSPRVKAKPRQRLHPSQLKHSYQSVATSFKDTETHRSHDRANLQTEKIDCVSLSLLLQRHKTPESNLRWTTPSVEKTVSRRRVCATPWFYCKMLIWFLTWFSPFKPCFITLHLSCYKRRGTFAYKVITCLIDIYSKGHRNSVEHVISKTETSVFRQTGQLRWMCPQRHGNRKETQLINVMLKVLGN